MGTEAARAARWPRLPRLLHHEDAVRHQQRRPAACSRRRLPTACARLPRSSFQLLRGQRLGPQTCSCPMNLFRRFRLARDRSVTVANVADELLRRNGDREVSVEESGGYQLSELHAELVCFDAFLRRTVGLRPGEPVAIYR